MDAVTLALAKQYTDSKQLGSYARHEIVCDFLAESNVQGTVLGYPLRHFSNKAPTPEELKAASATMRFQKDNITFNVDLHYSSELSSSSGMCYTFWDGDYIQFPVGILAVYEDGEHTFDYGEQTHTAVAPRKGLYVMIPDEAVAAMGQEGLFTVDIAWESVKTIDPKVLPGVCLPVVEIETVPDFEGGSMIQLTETESANLSSAAELCVPCVIRFTSFGGCFVFSFGQDENVAEFTFDMHGVDVRFTNSGDGWYVYASSV